MLHFAAHALDRVRERGISQSDVEFAWAHPASATVSGRRPDTRKFVGRTATGTDLIVVVAKDDRRRIITVWVK
jgi:hypothetical protein